MHVSFWSTMVVLISPIVFTAQRWRSEHTLQTHMHLRKTGKGTTAEGPKEKSKDTQARNSEKMTVAEHISKPEVFCKYHFELWRNLTGLGLHFCMYLSLSVDVSTKGNPFSTCHRGCCGLQAGLKRGVRSEQPILQRHHL